MSKRPISFNRTPMVNIGRNEQMSVSAIADVINDICSFFDDRMIRQISVRKNSKVIAVMNEPLRFFANPDNIGFQRDDKTIPLAFPIKSIMALYCWHDCFDHAQMLHINMRNGTRYMLNLWLK